MAGGTKSVSSKVRNRGSLRNSRASPKKPKEQTAEDIAKKAEDVETFIATIAGFSHDEILTHSDWVLGKSKDAFTVKDLYEALEFLNEEVFKKLRSESTELDSTDKDSSTGVSTSPSDTSSPLIESPGTGDNPNPVTAFNVNQTSPLSILKLTVQIVKNSKFKPKPVKEVKMLFHSIRQFLIGKSEMYALSWTLRFLQESTWSVNMIKQCVEFCSEERKGVRRTKRGRGDEKKSSSVKRAAESYNETPRTHKNDEDQSEDTDMKTPESNNEDTPRAASEETKNPSKIGLKQGESEEPVELKIFKILTICRSQLDIGTVKAINRELKDHNGGKNKFRNTDRRLDFVVKISEMFGTVKPDKDKVIKQISKALYDSYGNPAQLIRYLVQQRRPHSPPKRTASAPYPATDWKKSPNSDWRKFPVRDWSRKNKGWQSMDWQNGRHSTPAWSQSTTAWSQSTTAWSPSPRVSNITRPPVQRNTWNGWNSGWTECGPNIASWNPYAAFDDANTGAADCDNANPTHNGTNPSCNNTTASWNTPAWNMPVKPALYPRGGVWAITNWHQQCGWNQPDWCDNGVGINSRVRLQSGLKTKTRSEWTGWNQSKTSSTASKENVPIVKLGKSTSL